MKTREHSQAFDAFISYGGSREMARLIFSRLSRIGASPWSLWKWWGLRVFFDKREIRAGDDLPETISNAVRNSRYFILLASRAAARSKWVSKEIEFWLRCRPASDILIVVLDGSVAWDAERNDFNWHGTDCIPPILGGKYKEICWEELQGVSASAFAWRDRGRLREVVESIAAKIKGVPKEEISSRERTRRRLTLAAAVILMSSLIVSLTQAVLLNRRASRLRAEAGYAAGQTLIDQRENLLHVREALVNIDQALAEDPENEKALLGKAFALTLLIGFGGSDDPPRDLEETESAMSRVRRTDSSEYRHVKGRIVLYKYRDVPGARSLLLEAVALDQENVEARHSLASTYTFLGEHERAKELCREAIEIARRLSGGKRDKRLTRAQAILAWTHYHAGEYAAARELCELILEEDSTYDLARRYLGHIYTQERDYARAIENFRYAGGDSIENINLYASLTCTHALAGEMGVAYARIGNLLTRRAAGKYVSHYRLAQCYAAFGETDKAIEQLRAAREDKGDLFVLWSAVDPLFSKLSGSADFRDYLTGVGLGSAVTLTARTLDAAGEPASEGEDVHAKAE